MKVYSIFRVDGVANTVTVLFRTVDGDDTKTTDPIDLTSDEFEQLDNLVANIQKRLHGTAAPELAGKPDGTLN